MRSSERCRGEGTTAVMRSRPPVRRTPLARSHSSYNPVWRQVCVEQGGAQVGVQPGAVPGDGLVVAEAEALEVDQLGVGRHVQPGSGVGVLPTVGDEQLAALLDAARLELVEQGVHHAQLLGDHVRVRHRGPPPRGLDEAVVTDPAQGLADGVPADPVDLAELHLARGTVRGSHPPPGAGSGPLAAAPTGAAGRTGQAPGVRADGSWVGSSPFEGSASIGWRAARGV